MGALSRDLGVPRAADARRWRSALSSGRRSHAGRAVHLRAAGLRGAARLTARSAVPPLAVRLVVAAGSSPRGAAPRSPTPTRTARRRFRLYAFLAVVVVRRWVGWGRPRVDGSGLSTRSSPTSLALGAACRAPVLALRRDRGGPALAARAHAGPEEPRPRRPRVAVPPRRRARRRSRVLLVAASRSGARASVAPLARGRRRATRTSGRRSRSRWALRARGLRGRRGADRAASRPRGPGT